MIRSLRELTSDCDEASVIRAREAKVHQGTSGRWRRNSAIASTAFGSVRHQKHIWLGPMTVLSPSRKTG